MKLQALAGRVYRALRDAFWASPIARWSSAANAAIRLGYLARRWLRLSPQRGEVALVHGHRMLFEPGSECYLDMTSGTWEPGTTRLVESLLEPGMVFVDVGSHIGYYALLAARKVGPSGKVYAFEPAPANHAILVENITLNGYQNIVPVQKAVSDRQGTATFFLHANPVGHSFHPETLGKSQTAITVETTSLDDFFEGAGWPPVHLVKMDIEGAEPAALRGMAKLLERNRDLRLIVEYIPHILERAGESPLHFLEEIRGLGFTIQVISDRHGPQSLTDQVARRRGLRAELLCERKVIP